MLDSEGNPTLPATPLPDFIELDAANTEFDWLTLSGDDEGVYVIRLSGFIDGESVSVDFTIDVQVCNANIVSVGTQSISNPSVYSLSSGNLNLPIVFAQTQIGCTITYELAEGSGAYGSFDTEILSFNTQTGVITVNAETTQADVYNANSPKTLKVRATSSGSGNTAEYSF